MSEMTERRLTRRDALAATLGGSVLLASGAGLAACGGGGPSASPGGVAGRPRRGGHLRVATIGSPTDSLDAHRLLTETDNYYANALYEGLTRFDHQFRPQPALAEELTVAPDARSWTLRLRKDATFHDGRPVTADDVIYTIRRILDPKTAAAGGLMLASIDPRRFRKRDARTLEINLSEPDVSLDSAFAKYNGIVPVGYDPNRPIGAGPFKLARFDPSQRVAFERFDGYVRAGMPYLDTLEFVVFADQTALFDALNSGAVDAAGRLGTTDVELARGNPRLRLVRSRTGAVDLTVMRCSQGVFKDVRLRQAMRLMVDREQLIQQVYGGYGALGNDLPSKQDPMYDAAIPQRTQDLDKARALIKAAGAEGLRITYTAAPVSSFAIRQAEVIAEQAKAVGIDVRIDKQQDAGQYYAKYYGNTDLQLETYFTNTLWFMAASSMIPGGPYNTTHWDNPRATALFRAARSTVDEARRRQLLADFQRIYWDEGGWIIWGYVDMHDALSTRFTGIVEDVAGSGVNGGRFEEIGLA